MSFVYFPKKSILMSVFVGVWYTNVTWQRKEEELDQNLLSCSILFIFISTAFHIIQAYIQCK